MEVGLPHSRNAAIPSRVLRYFADLHPYLHLHSVLVGWASRFLSGLVAILEQVRPPAS
jgi:hypothetical protein